MKKTTKEQRLYNNMFNNFAMSALSFLFISISGKILVHSIEFFISMPFVLNESSLYIAMDKSADFIGNNIYVLGIIISLLFFIKGLFLFKKCNEIQKKEA